MNPKFSTHFLLEEFDETQNGGGDTVDVNLDTGDDEADVLEDVNLDAPSISDSSLDPDALATSVAQRLGHLIPQDRQSRDDQQQYTPEQRAAFLKEMGRVEVGKDFITALRNGELDPQEAAAQFQQILDNTVNHALKLAGLATNHHVTQLRQTYDPLLAKEKDAVASQFYTEVETAYPSLKGQSKIIRMAADQMMRGGYKSQGAERDALNLAVAAARLIKEVNPQFTLKRAKTGGGRAGMPSMAASRSGAGGGGTSGGRQKQPMSNAQALYFRKK